MPGSGRGPVRAGREEATGLLDGEGWKGPLSMMMFLGRVCLPPLPRLGLRIPGALDSQHQ